MINEGQETRRKQLQKPMKNKTVKSGQRKVRFYTEKQRHQISHGKQSKKHSEGISLKYWKKINNVESYIQQKHIL